MFVPTVPPVAERRIELADEYSTKLPGFEAPADISVKVTAEASGNVPALATPASITPSASASSRSAGSTQALGPSSAVIAPGSPVVLR